MSKPLRIAFMGTPDFAAAALDALHAAGHDIACVYSQPPRPSGRGQKLQPSPVHRRAAELGLPVRTPLSLKKDKQAQEDFAALNLDAAIVAAYGLILPKAVLDAPKHGCINIHASLLPRWRGAAPIQRAILAGDHESGVCIMRMEEGLDTGPVLIKGRTPITDTTTSSTLHDALAKIGADLIVKTLAQIDTLKAVPQPEDGVTYAKKLDKDEGRIDWTKSAADIARQVRALGTFATLNGQRLKVLEAEPAAGTGKPGEILSRNLTVATGNGALLLKKIQPQDRKPMDGLSFMNGTHMNVGDLLS